MVASYVNLTCTCIHTPSQFMIQYDDSQIGPLDDEGEIPSTNTSNDKWLLEYAIQDFSKHHKDKYVHSILFTVQKKETEKNAI